MRLPCKEVRRSYKAILLAGCALSAIHAGDWARYLWQGGQRVQAIVVLFLCVLVVLLGIKSIGVV